MRGIHDDVEKHLIEFAHVTNNRRNLPQVRVELSQVLVLVARDRERTPDRRIQIRRGWGILVRMRKLLHRAYDSGHPVQSFQGALHRLGHVFRQEIEVCGLLRGAPAVDHLRGSHGAGRGGHAGLPVGTQDLAHLAHRVAQKMAVVADKLHGRVDFVSDARRETAHRLQFLSLLQFHLQLLLRRNVDTDPTHYPACRRPRSVPDKAADICDPLPGKLEPAFHHDIVGSRRILQRLGEGGLIFGQHPVEQKAALLEQPGLPAPLPPHLCADVCAATAGVVQLPRHRAGGLEQRTILLVARFELSGPLEHFAVCLFALEFQAGRLLGIAAEQHGTAGTD